MECVPTKMHTLQEAIETYILVFVDLSENAPSEKPNDEPALAKIAAPIAPFVRAGGWMPTTMVQDWNYLLIWLKIRDTLPGLDAKNPDSSQTNFANTLEIASTEVDILPPTDKNRVKTDLLLFKL